MKKTHFLKKIQTTSQQGITLIELLVVVAILGILAVVLIGAIDPIAQIERGRDSRRIKDMKAAQSAFEQYYTLNDNDYDSCASMAAETFQGGNLPETPSRTRYQWECHNTWYAICAELQNDAMRARFGNHTSGIVAGALNPNDYIPPGSAVANFYCLENLQ